MLPRRSDRYSLQPLPSLPFSENTTQDARRHLRHSVSAGSSADIYENTRTMPRPPHVAQDQLNPMHKFYTLAELSDQFTLPQMARVVEGYYGPTETSRISNDTVLLLCFQNVTKVVTAIDKQKITYSVPRDSTLLYSPVDPSYGPQGHIYKGVGELYSCGELPQVVRVDSKTAQSMQLSDDGLLFPSRKERDTFGKSCLLCYDRKDRKLRLPPTQVGFFSTQPEDVKMYMSECLWYVKKLPIDVVLIDVNNSMPTGTTGSILTLTAKCDEKSIVAKTVSKTDGIAAKMIEIPLDLPIKLQCLSINSHKDQREAIEAKQNYELSGTASHCTMATTETADELQSSLYMNVKLSAPRERYMTMRRSVPSASSEDSEPQQIEPLYENLVEAKNNTPLRKISQPLAPKPQETPLHQPLAPGIPLHQPQAPKPQEIGNMQSRLPVQVNSISEHDQLIDEDEYCVIPKEIIGMVKPIEKRCSTFGNDSDGYLKITAAKSASLPKARTLPAKQLLHQTDSSDPEALLGRIKQLEENNVELNKQLQNITNVVTQLQTSMKQLQCLLATQRPDDNIKQLSFMDSNTLLTLLQSMGLSKYEQIFREHKVDGAKMARLDTKRLTQYGITDSNDLAKLVDIIKGHVSPLIYFMQQQQQQHQQHPSEDDPYMKFTKTPY